ncbi:MAG: hypothetical protein DMF95_31310 [Acidobacteria bacterium]|nr:MAG: hypothetical protein DMF96_29785 [Acidobacteriota bacterium]PYR14769.1 MAG: hypothetical protein DMF94_33825 [Acidobacteriota bacterium]PYR41326.1 MAG: hypothetical protein DMF95_31310 [Acidobacteriota bacterium]
MNDSDNSEDEPLAECVGNTPQQSLFKIRTLDEVPTLIIQPECLQRGEIVLERCDIGIAPVVRAFPPMAIDDECPVSGFVDTDSRHLYDAETLAVRNQTAYESDMMWFPRVFLFVLVAADPQFHFHKLPVAMPADERRPPGGATGGWTGVRQALPFHSNLPLFVFC